MALALDPTLAEAMDSGRHHPIVEIISSQLAPDIPFDGQFLTSSPQQETKPNVIYHSNGSICIIYVVGTTEFKYVYTNIERTIFNSVSISLPSGYIPIEASLCEMTNGNIGIIYIATHGANRALRFLIISQTGEATNIPDTLIGNEYVTASYEIDNPFVIRTATGGYLLVYYHKTVSGATYKIQKRTSTIFTDWSIESECEMSNLTSTKPRCNPSLLKISNGNIFLWFDYRDDLIENAELTNIYYSISTNHGGAWGEAQKITNYTTYDTVGKHPVAVQKVNNEMHMAFYEQKNALHYTFGAGLASGDVTFAAQTRKLYIPILGSTTGALYKIDEINVDTWLKEREWNCVSDPAFNAVFCGAFGVKPNRHHSEYPYISLGIVDSITVTLAAILDVSSNVILHYYFRTSPNYGITQNVSGLTLAYLEELRFTWIDSVNNRFYCLFGNGWSGQGLRFGYFQVGQYNWNEIFFDTGVVGQPFNSIVIEPGIDRVFIAIYSPSGIGELRVYSLSSGFLIKTYKQATEPQFPQRGLKFITYLNGSIYGVSSYLDLPYVGLVKIDLTTHGIVHYIPSWGDYSDYSFNNLKIISNEEIAVLSTLYGISIFNINDLSWEVINNTNLPGLTPSGQDSFFNGISYDSLQETIFATVTGIWNGMVGVSKYGAFKSVYYKLGVYNVGWTFGDNQSMTREWTDSDLAMCLSIENVRIYAFWNKKDQNRFRIKWDTEGGSLDVTPYIINDSITLARVVDGTPGALSFDVSHGHLFDSYNTNSLLSGYLSKFRRLNIRFGEKVEGTNYWQQQGVFIIKETQIKYQRKQYPVLGIKAEDELSIWESHHVAATDYYEDTPKNILEDIVEEIGGLDSDEHSFPILDGSCVLYYQWVDVTLKSILEQICERFGYFLMIDVDGKVTARKISESNSINHEYDSSVAIIDFTPDDSFSDFVNRVIITCDGRDLIEVVYPEEMVAELHKTVGWWGHKEHHNVWYSVDGTRRCRYPRLEVVESVKNFNFKLGGGSERIDSTDPAERYCVVKIKSPNLVAWLIVAIVLYIVLRILENLWPQIFGLNVFGILAAILLSVIITTIASVANCSYIIWACPIGSVRQTFQGVADNLELQGILGFIVEKTYHDNLCYTSYQCTIVAQQELLIADFQRNRVKITKITHLQDEIGDTITVKHPYSQNTIKLFIASLERTFKKPTGPDSNDGYFLDSIEGWIIQ
jgi:hypothetical protein